MVRSHSSAGRRSSGASGHATALSRIQGVVSAGGTAGHQLRHIVESLSRFLGSVTVLGVSSPAGETGTVLVSENGASAHHPPARANGRPKQGNGHGNGAGTAWPRSERFLEGDLTRSMKHLPHALRAPLRGLQRGVLALLPLHGPGSAAGVLLVHRPAKPFCDDERSLLRAAARQLERVLELRDALERSREALEARDEFLGLASHELASPLATASLLAASVERALERKPVDLDAQTWAALRMTRHQLDRASALVRRLADAARRARQAPEPQPADMDLVELVQEVVAQLRLRDSRGHTVRLTLGQPELRGSWDRAQLEELVENLLTNAVKFGGGHPVLVSLRRVGSGAELRVKDQGIGIQRTDQARIFRRFARAVPHRQFPGIGIGLWLVKQIVTSHGGHISLTSEPGAGSEFVVWLPGARPAPAGSEEEQLS